MAPSRGGGRSARRSRRTCFAAGYDAERGTFVQYYGSDRLDASLLLIPLVGFLPADDPRVVGTVAAIQRELLRDGFVERYRADTENVDVDGLPPGEGVFLPCSFWLAAVLAQQGRRDEARPALRAAALPAKRPRPALRGVRPGAPAPRRELPAGVHAPHARRDGVHAVAAAVVLSRDREEAPLSGDALQRCACRGPRTRDRSPRRGRGPCPTPAPPPRRRDPRRELRC